MNIITLLFCIFIYQIPVYAHVPIHAKKLTVFVPLCIEFLHTHKCSRAHTRRHMHTHTHVNTYACLHTYTHHSVFFTCYKLPHRSLTLTFNKKSNSMLELLWFENRFVVQKWWFAVLYLGKMTGYNLLKETTAILTLETAWVRHVWVTNHFKVTLHVSHLYNTIKSPKNVTI